MVDIFWIDWDIQLVEHTNDVDTLQCFREKKEKLTANSPLPVIVEAMLDPA